ncbi:M20/M25/M40 family metallo-hydrolase [Longimicrobium sp.]|uniref:M20/M25/M40 family metallo-hydrolase n=1 Tax=Longimicrobium sp. TaxID=2029185 RepID=UPI002E338446|nr:M20/M25/M40 family metallo-hydrolase [Longimicrobium sp.]HEX6038544.1 M20/M25/M40 family metallo-hydrolase [Longimicrobium sp.]
MKLRTYAASCAALALAACAAPASGPATAPAPSGGAPAGLTPAQAVATITPADVFARIEFLASDRMRGRNTPSPELELTAEYLVNQYKLMGFTAGGENNSFLQWYPYPLRQLDAAGARLEVAGAGGTTRLAYGRDFFASGGTAQPLSSAALAYAGRGADAVLAEGSLRGQLAVVAIPGRYTRDWRLERTRLRNAAQRAGAQAVVFVLDPSWTADSVARYAQTAQAPSRTLGGQVAYPMFFVTQDAARRVFSAGGLSLDEQWRGAEGVTRIVPLAGATATAALPVRTLDEGRAPNVVAVLPGSDPALRDEYVVLSAHMDGLGVGEAVDGDSIYNGADDDASGTTGLLEVAQAMSQLGVRPRRSIVFLHVSGEEKGLLGSEWYSDHPTLPLAQTVANVNVDMIGRNAADSVVVIGKDYSTLGDVTNRLNTEHPELNLTLADDMWPEQRFFFRSDHFNFARKEVPAIFFFSGVHADYHRPSDEVETIDTDKATRISRMVFYLVYDIANNPQRPQWDPRGLEEVRSLTR